MIELLALALLGCVLGVFTGMVPGIHVNTLSLLALSFGFFGNIELAALVVAMAVTHSFVDFIPSIVFGAPDSGSFLSVLPGHRFLMKGEGMKAVQLTVAGGLFGGIGALAVSGIFMGFVSAISAFLPMAIPSLLLAVLCLMVYVEKGLRKKAVSVIVILLSAMVGISVLTLNPFPNSIMPPIIGFFAAGSLVFSIISKPAMKRQRVGETGVPWKSVVKGSLLSIAGAGTVSVMPGIGPSQAAFLVRKLTGKMRPASYLSMLGGINTANILLSLFVMLSVGKTRTGIAVVLKQVLPREQELVLLFCGSALVAICFSVFATHALARFFLARIHLLPYRAINAAVLAGLACLVLYFSGPHGLAVAGVSACIALAALAENVKRSHCMAFLMVPTIIAYLGM